MYYIFEFRCSCKEGPIAWITFVRFRKAHALSLLLSSAVLSNVHFISATMNLSAIAAPMVNQSDLPFRLLVRRYKTSLVYTQMLQPSLLLDDRDYLDFHLRGLETERQLGLDDTVVQLCGNDPQMLVNAGRKVQSLCTCIGASILFFRPICHIEQVLTVQI